HGPLSDRSRLGGPWQRNRPSLRQQWRQSSWMLFPWQFSSLAGSQSPRLKGLAVSTHRIDTAQGYGRSVSRTGFAPSKYNWADSARILEWVSQRPAASLCFDGTDTGLRDIPPRRIDRLSLSSPVQRYSPGPRAVSAWASKCDGKQESISRQLRPNVQPPSPRYRA